MSYKPLFDETVGGTFGFTTSLPACGRCAPRAAWIAEMSVRDVSGSADIEMWFRNGLQRIVADLSHDPARE